MAESSLHASYLGHSPVHHAHGVSKASTWSLLDEPKQEPAASASATPVDEDTAPTKPADTPSATAAQAAKSKPAKKSAKSSSDQESVKKIKFLEGKLKGMQQSASDWKDKCLKVSSI